MARRTLSARSLASTALIGGLILGNVGCDGDLVNLGNSGDSLKGGAGAGGSSEQGGGAPLVWRAQVEPIVEQQADILLANPTLVRDLSVLYYSSQPRTGTNPVTGIERAAAAGDLFDASAAVTLGASSSVDVSSPAVSLDADELWLGMNNGAAATDIYRSTPQGDAWTEPELVPELCSDFDDAPRPPAMNGTVMPLSSKRHGGVHYQIYLASRDTLDSTWREPTKTQLGAIDSTADDFQTADGFLSETGLELYFSSTRPGNGKDADLYVARRASVNEDFGDPEPLSDLNTSAEERMPWLSPRGDRLYYASNQSGQYALYVATKIAP